ncbi:methyltransferase family protein [Jatrophihabitans sp. GAS493]|uniref:class I SAM-dependent methyltransferase n=1 Tax=Jatrophihabitans sp. GAS493 TaxID=1907575 RepID=UPI000BB92832|nr:class I SAM-dependent methyltransferase [Jatrophihabitans sp. GAS493]SOD70994.1 methyltransferase family protein [Jatrophihabitans sp. GAS493]
MDEWAELNRRHWDERAAPHAASDNYAFSQFVEDRQFLSEVIRFDRPRLGDLTGLRGVHLQCHIGTDTISLARLGARMTGLDFSPASLTQARILAARTGSPTDFVEAEVYSAPEVLEAGSFDLVFTGIGALCWLPSIRRWADVVATLLRPGGRLHLREGHPMLWSLQDGRDDDLLVVDFPYFEQPTPTVWDEPGTYVETDHQFVHTTSADWSHGIGEIVTALMDAGLELTMLVEHDSVPWEALPGQMVKLPNGEYRLRTRPERLPHTYTLQAVRR